MSLTFKYKKIERPPPAGMAYVPYIPLTFTGPNTSIEVMALLDSGADVSAIPKDVAEILGIPLDGKREEIGGIGGKVGAIESSVNVLVQGSHERYQFNMKVKVILDEHDSKFPIILGRLGFFDKFDITFVERHRKVVLRKRD